MIDENLFFREISMRICGSLDIEKGLESWTEYLAQHMPADNLFLEEHIDGLNGIEIVAQSGIHRRLKTGVVIRFPDEFREEMLETEKQIRAGVYAPLEVINRPKEHPLGMFILEVVGAPTSCYMGLPLVIGDKLVGGLGVIAEGEDRFWRTPSKSVRHLEGAPLCGHLKFLRASGSAHTERSPCR